MPSACAVPNCRTGKTNKIKKKYSIFKVPNDAYLRKKWENAIPQVSTLKTTQYVCERHFEEKCIIRRYIKHDNEGNIIADIPYKRPRLQINSVPSLFDGHIKSLTVKEINDKSLQPINNDYSTIIFSELPSSEVDVEATINNGIIIPIEPNFENSQIFANFCLQDNIPISNENENENILPDINTDFSEEKEIFNNTNINECTEIDEKLDLNEKHKILTIADDSVIQDTILIIDGDQIEAKNFNIIVTEESDVKFKKENDLTNTETDKKEIVNTKNVFYLDHNYTVNVPKISKSLNTVQIDDDSINLPQFWGISENYSKSRKRLVFTHTHIQTKIKSESVVLYKCVTIDIFDGKIEYFVYGRQLDDTHHLNLPSILSKNTMLVPILKRFQGIHACEGIGSIDISVVKNSNVFSDILCFGCNYHDSQCTLLSTTKKCKHCDKLQKTILQRHKQVIKQPKIIFKKIHKVSPILSTTNCQKLQFFKRKLHREKKRLKKLQHLVNKMQYSVNSISN